MNKSHPYFEMVALLTSKHQKLPLIASHFRDSCGVIVKEVELDTDLLGTFAGEVERVGTPLETAIRKANLGLAQSDETLGISSEGSIAPDPAMPFIQADIELVVLVDRRNQIVISEMYRSFEIKAISRIISPGEDIDELLQSADFPNHHLIVKANQCDKGEIFKGINSRSQLKEAIEISAAASSDNKVQIQSDLRANHSPSRQKNISEAARLLSLKVASLCPSCAMPGWGRTDFLRGLECSACALPISNALHREIWGCVKCPHTQLGSVIATEVNPANCPQCNP